MADIALRPRLDIVPSENLSGPNGGSEPVLVWDCKVGTHTLWSAPDLKSAWVFRDGFYAGQQPRHADGCPKQQ